MDGYCRACLVNYEEPGDLLQYTEKKRRLFVYSTGLQVKRNDPLTFQVCKDCYFNMKIACKFKKLCRTSDKKFKSYVAMKNAGDTADFETYLKHNVDALPFRYPLLSGNSTPANQRSRDDDNESTCTSIRNFMSDMLQGEEVPDTEARIIREVIEEEADVLDDSLDSHWLQDENTNDMDFRLDISFSPFSTPRLQKDNCYTPKKIDDQKINQANYFESCIEGDKDQFNMNGDSDNHGKPEQDDDMGIADFTSNIDDVKGGMFPNVLNYYVPNDSMDMNTSIELSDDHLKLVKPCTIDRNLEKALENEDNRVFSLDGLLVSPPVYQGASGASTPTIKNILFGAKLDSPVNVEQRNKEDEIKRDILDEFLINVPEEYNLDTDDVKESNVEDLLNTNCGGKENDINSMEKIIDLNQNTTNEAFDLENFYCKLCDRKFKNSKSMSVHFTKKHNMKFVKPKSRCVNKPALCNICGKVYSNQSNYLKHLKKHQKPKESEIHKCGICPLTCTTAAKLKMHMVRHDVEYVKKEPKKKFVCNDCGAVTNTVGNLRLHQRRHRKEYSLKCDECGQGFYRLSDLTVHMRKHTGEEPFSCILCTRRFKYRDSLAKHIRLHSAENWFKCEYCAKKFTKRTKMVQHLTSSKRCLKKQTRIVGGKLKEKKDGNVDVVYMAGDMATINKEMTKNKELPFLDTENST